MIERQTIGGREATIAYFDEQFNPVSDLSLPHLAKILFDDCEMLLLSSDKPTEPTKAPAPEPLDAGDEHEHDGKPFDKHRTRFAKKRLIVYGKSLAEWAQQIAVQEAERIKTAISVGLTAGEDNTDIAHRVIGSRRANGVEGATEITRQHFLRLGKGLLQKRKTRMSGDSPDVRRV